MFTYLFGKIPYFCCGREPYFYMCSCPPEIIRNFHTILNRTILFSNLITFPITLIIWRCIKTIYL